MQSISQLDESCFVCKATIKDQTVYFGMENIDKKNHDHWTSYAADCEFMTRNSRGIIEVLSILKEKEKVPLFSEIEEVTGFSELEYNEYMNQLKKRRGGIGSVASGVAGFDITNYKNCYVVYASKVPILGRFPFMPRKNPWITLKEFNIYYDNILMTLRSVMLEGDVYNNRGIFRNPKSFVDGGYDSLSMYLHCFSANVAMLFFNKKYMSISPIPVMAKILETCLEKEDYYCGKQNIPSKYHNTLLGYGALDVPFLIKVEALCAFHS